MHNGLQRHVTGVMYVSRGASMVQCICIKRPVYQWCNACVKRYINHVMYVSRGVSMV